MRDEHARDRIGDVLTRVLKIESILNDYRGSGFIIPGLTSQVSQLQETVAALIPEGYEVVKLPSTPAQTVLRKKNA